MTVKHVYVFLLYTAHEKYTVTALGVFENETAATTSPRKSITFPAKRKVAILVFCCTELPLKWACRLL